ncbi:SGNH hydrolase-type esterase domain-containing protein [Xylaria cf. heliscus]|nr:SGNH hydrolase-type esterase domain-containing protein [Xylaria cf. heliscus]
MTSEFEKPVPTPRRSRLAFMKTKRVIAVLTILVVGLVVLIALGATHVLTPQNHNSVGNHNVVGDALGSSNNDNNITSTSDDGSSPKSGGKTSSDGSDDSTDSNGNSSEVTHGGSKSNSTSGDDHGSPRVNSSDNDDDDDDSGDGKGAATKSTGLWRPDNSSNIADGTPLRIMCLGASIVKGETSPDSNGFRKTLRAELAGLGAPINMVGSQRYGDMPDNDFEAYGGNRVSQIHDHATKIVPQLLPNVFVINVGTNNALQRRDVDVAGKDMEAFVDYLLSASPRSTVVMSTLLTNKVPGREPLILDINQQFRELFQKYENKSVVLAELHTSEGLPGRPQPEDIGPDGSHPLEQGYQIMGHLLAEAVKEADRKGYLRWPENGEQYDGEAGRIDTTTPGTTEASPPRATGPASGTSSTGK